MKKNRGAPPGNQNALKHGFYSAAFKAAEARLLSEVPAHDLSAEVELLRVASVRLLQAINDSPDGAALSTQLAAVRALNLSAHSIASLLRVQAKASALRLDAAELEQLLKAHDQWAAAKRSAADGAGAGHGS